MRLTSLDRTGAEAAGRAAGPWVAPSGRLARPSRRSTTTGIGAAGAGDRSPSWPLNSGGSASGSPPEGPLAGPPWPDRKAPVTTSYGSPGATGGRSLGETIPHAAGTRIRICRDTSPCGAPVPFPASGDGSDKSFPAGSADQTILL